MPATLKVNDYNVCAGRLGAAVLVCWQHRLFTVFSSKQDSYRDLVTSYQYTVYCIGISVIVLSDDMCAVHNMHCYWC